MRASSRYRKCEIEENTFNLVQKCVKKKGDSTKKKKKNEYNRNIPKNGVPLRGLNAMPFRTEARKCNHWAKGGLRELDSKFNATYTRIKSRFYFVPHLAMENVGLRKRTFNLDQKCVKEKKILRKKNGVQQKYTKNTESPCGG